MEWFIYNIVSCITRRYDIKIDEYLEILSSASFIISSANSLSESMFGSSGMVVFTYVCCGLKWRLLKGHPEEFYLDLIGSFHKWPKLKSFWQPLISWLSIKVAQCEVVWSWIRGSRVIFDRGEDTLNLHQSLFLLICYREVGFEFSFIRWKDGRIMWTWYVLTYFRSLRAEWMLKFPTREQMCRVDFVLNGHKWCLADMQTKGVRKASQPMRSTTITARIRTRTEYW